MGGFLGIGGGIILIPALTEVLGPDQHLYQAAAMIVYVFVAIPAVYQHHRARLLMPRLIRQIGTSATVATLAGVAISELPFFAGKGEAYLRLIFGVFLLVCAAYEVHRARLAAKKSNEPAPLQDVQVPPLSLKKIVWVGLSTGFYTGLLGVGGGIVAVPAQRRALKIPLRNAIANSSAIMIITCSIGALVKNVAYIHEHEGSPESLLLAAILIPTAIAGSLLGSRGTSRVPLLALRIALILVLFLSGARMFQGALVSLWR